MSMQNDNVTNQLAKSGCFCLNESPRNPFSNLFVGDHTLALTSDTDEQLILHLAFMQTIKLASISLGIPGDDTCPKTIRLFCNQSNLGFSEANGTDDSSHC